MRLDENINNALDVNLGYKKGEKVVIVSQKWDASLGEDCKEVIDTSSQLCRYLFQVYYARGVDVEFFSYVPTDLRGGVDPTSELYDQFSSIDVPEIVIAPCAYSITHTKWRRKQCDKGSRIVTMSNSSLGMFCENGPFDFKGDYGEVVDNTEMLADMLRDSRLVKIIGKNTNLIIEVDNDNVHASTGLTVEPGSYGNWLGAEAFAPPVADGATFGDFMVPKGCGGREQFPYDMIFNILLGRFQNIISLDPSTEAEEWIDEHLRLLMFGTEGHEVVAELGLGTNPAVEAGYLRKNWSIAVGEKKANTVHIAHGNNKSMGGKNDVAIHQDFVIPFVDKIEFL